MKEFYFTLGPVDGFITASRRARDYWAGSFILSWLSAHAICAALEKGATITSPVAVPSPINLHQVDELLANVWVVRNGGAAAPIEMVPRLPNSFRALSDDTGLGDACRKAVIEAWKRLADAVWDVFLASLAADATVKKRWDEQIGDFSACFWETTWVQGTPPNGSTTDRSTIEDWMAARKRVRLPFFIGDLGEGERCMMLPDFLELSGKRRERERDEQNQFWEAVIDAISRAEYGSPPSGRTLELRKNERLSAPALVKRLFAKLPQEKLKEVFGWEPAGLRIWMDRIETIWQATGTAGWSARFYPSTVAISAYYWFDAVRRMDGQNLDQIAGLVEALSWPLAVAERQNRLWETELWIPGETGLREGIEESLVRFVALDGRVVTQSALRNANFIEEMWNSDGTRASGELSEDKKESARAIFESRLEDLNLALGELKDTLKEEVSTLPDAPATIREPSKYLAVLQMDGDGIGTLLSGSDAQNREKIQAALNDFAASVRGENITPPSVPGTMDHLAGSKGEILYAAGDELRAVMPVDDAVTAALEIRRRFLSELSSAGLPHASISASIVFARNDLSFGWVMRASDELLERAKSEGNGNCLGIEIMDFGRERDRVLMSWDDRPADSGPTLAEFLRDAPFLERSARIWAHNRVFHDIDAELRRHGPLTPAKGLQGQLLSEFPGQLAGLTGLVKALALQAAGDAGGSVHTVGICKDAAMIGGLLCPATNQASTGDRYAAARNGAGISPDVTQAPTTRAAPVAVDGLAVLRFLVRERRKLTQRGASAAGIVSAGAAP